MQGLAARFTLLASLAILASIPARGEEEEVLLGRTRPGAILSISPRWQDEFDAYAPAAADLQAFSEAPRGSKLDVYLGSWCGDSRTGVPHLLKILDQAPRGRLKVRYYGVDRSKTEPAKMLLGVGLERVPTFVLSVRGREVGRVIETPLSTLEHDLALLIRKAAVIARP